MKNIGIIGLGNMGEAILRALLASGLSKESILCFEIKTDRLQSMKEAYSCPVAKGIDDLVRQSRHILLAVKPQDSKSVLREIAPEMNESRVLISIMAGVTTESILSTLGRPAKMVRVMPNICVTVAEAALGVAPGELLTSSDVQSVTELLRPLGRLVFVTEEQMDAVTALSGSGPAFVLAFLEGLIDGGVNMGLARDKARELAVQTIKGTIALLEKENLHPTLMKEKVTSPGGTTMAGLATLEEKGFKGTLIKCLKRAQDRARELSK